MYLEIHTGTIESMGNPFILPDSIELAKELAWDIEIRPNPPSEEDIFSALRLMNTALYYRRENDRSLIKTAVAYCIPDHNADLERLSESEVEDSIVANATVIAKIHEFSWFGSVSFSNFGLRLWGVKFLEPNLGQVPTVFVPLDYIDVKLSA